MNDDPQKMGKNTYEKKIILKGSKNNEETHKPHIDSII